MTTNRPEGGRTAAGRRDPGVTGQAPPSVLFIKEIGWSREEALETRARLATFEEDWNAPGMKAYDEL